MSKSKTYFENVYSYDEKEMIIKPSDVIKAIIFMEIGFIIGAVLIGL